MMSVEWRLVLYRCVACGGPRNTCKRYCGSSGGGYPAWGWGSADCRLTDGGRAGAEAHTQPWPDDAYPLDCRLVRHRTHPQEERQTKGS